MASEALGAAWRALVWSRLAILFVAVFAALSAGSEGRFEAAAERYDRPELTQPLGGLGDVLVSPLARWDSVWYLSVADSGYQDEDSHRTAFFPL